VARESLEQSNFGLFGDYFYPLTIDFIGFTHPNRLQVKVFKGLSCIILGR
jgi:hypothetical protein